MRPTLLFGSILLLAAASSTTACWGKDPFDPGEKLGTFHVSAQLVATTCGSAVNPWDFDVRLNHDGATLYSIQGGVPIPGQIDRATAHAALKSEARNDLRRADARAKLAACSVVRTDLLAVTLAGADAKPVADPSQMTTFSGGLAYTYVPTEGSDCTDQLAGSGGGFAALPCEIRYDIAGAWASNP